MTRTHERVWYTPPSKYGGHTPVTAVGGVEQAFKFLEGRWKLVILFRLFGGLGNLCISPARSRWRLFGMGCKARGAANSSTYSQAEQRRRPPEKPHPMRVAAKSGARFVALLGIVVQATTFVALRAIIPISRATRSAWGLCRGSLNRHKLRRRG